MRALFFLPAIALVAAPFLLLGAGDGREAAAPPTADVSAVVEPEPDLEPAQNVVETTVLARDEVAPAAPAGNPEVASSDKMEIDAEVTRRFDALFADASDEDREAAKAVFDSVFTER